MLYQRLDQVRAVADITEARPQMTRQQRLRRWADILSREGARPLEALRWVEFYAEPERRQLRRDGSPIALAYAEAITWDLETDDAFWGRLRTHFSEPELVEIGYFVAITMGQQRWLRTLNIEHHQILAGSDGSMAPGFETWERLQQSKDDPGYWARRDKGSSRQAAE